MGGGYLTIGVARGDAGSRSLLQGRGTTVKDRPYRFPPCFRLKKKSHFTSVQNLGKRLYSRHFLLLVWVSGLPCSRLGIAVTRKIDKRAVGRNRVKRMVRNIFRIHRQLLKEPCDIMVIARQDAPLCSFADVERELLGALHYHGYLA